SSRRRHTRFSRDWSSDVCSSDLGNGILVRISMHADFVARCGHFPDLTRKGFDGMARHEPAGLDAETVELRLPGTEQDRYVITLRSEERRVGKECKSRLTRDKDQT